MWLYVLRRIAQALLGTVDIIPEPSQMQAQFQEMMRTAMARGVADAVHRRTGGNPFFVSQLSRLHDEAGRGLEALAIPSGVRHVIGRRLSRLPVEVRDFPVFDSTTDLFLRSEA